MAKQLSLLFLLLLVPDSLQDSLICHRLPVPANQRTGVRPFSCGKSGEVISSIQYAAYGVANSPICPIPIPAFSCQSSSNVSIYLQQICLNKHTCVIPLSNLEMSCSSGNVHIYLVATCDFIGGPYLSLPTVGCPIGSLTTAGCCTAPTTCSGGTSLMPNGVCVASCSPGLAPLSTSAGSVCLDTNCTLASTSDCSKCAKCQDGMQVSNTGVCRLPPTINVSAPNFPNINALCGAPTFNLSTDSGSRFRAFNWSVNGATQSPGAVVTNATCVNGYPGPPASQSVYSLWLGVTFFNCTVSDSHGLSTSCLFSFRVADMEPPVIHCSDIIVTTLLNSNYAQLSPREFDVTDNSVTSANSLDPLDPLHAFPMTCNDSATIVASSTVANNSMLITCNATDGSGNIGYCSFRVTLLDQQPPSFLNYVVNGVTISQGSNNNVSILETPGTGFGTLSWSPPQATDNVASTVAVVCDYQNTTFPLGETAVNCTASDLSGNTNISTFYVRVADATPPRVTCPSDGFLPVGPLPAWINWTAPSYTDNVGVVATSLLYQGTVNLCPNVAPCTVVNLTTNLTSNLFSFSATDAAGNTAGCAWQIARLDSSTSAASTTALVGGAGAAAGVVIVLVGVLVIYRRIQQRRLKDAQQGYSELMAMSDEFILEKARVIQLTLMAQKQATAPSLAAQAAKPEREFEVPPATMDALKVYLKDTMKKNMERSCLVLNMEIGQGEFGSVFDGVYRHPQTQKETKVAVKQLKLATSDDSKLRFLKEAAINAQFNHPNIVRLIGVCLEPSAEPSLIVLEYMHLGSLKSYLDSPMIKDKLEPLTLLRMAIDASAGMMYLSEAGFVHRDIAARNVLIDKEMTCRIGDFGLSVDLASVSEEESGIYSGSEGARIPIRWSAPEAVLYRHFSTSSDVWSYGVLMWEIWTYGQMPYNDWPNKKVIQSVQSGYRLPKPEICPSEVYAIMIECFHKNPKHRPPFSRIGSGLIEIWKEINGSGDNFNRRNSLSENVLENSNLYDNNTTGMDAFEEDDDGAVAGYEGTLQETNLSVLSKAKKSKAAAQPLATSVYDVGGADGGSSYDEAQAPSGMTGKGSGSAATPAPTNASLLYDVGGDEPALVLPSQVAAKRPSNHDLDAILTKQHHRESLGLATMISAKNLGQRVVADGYGEGVLAFVGPSLHDGEVHCGIELEEETGISDGIFHGKRYFTCAAKHAVLVPIAQVSLVVRGVRRVSETSDSFLAGNRRPSYFPLEVSSSLEDSAVSNDDIVALDDDESTTQKCSGYLEMVADD